MILAGDIGGTNARLALYGLEDNTLQRRCSETYSSADYESIIDIINVFKNEYPGKITGACFGIPGPVVNGKVKTTNLSWTVNEEAIAQSLQISSVRLVNDLAAITAAVPHLTSEQVIEVYAGKPGEDTEKKCAVLAPGTGLGVGFIARAFGRTQVFASEGGHTDFAPNTELEIELLKYLRTKYKHVSYERMLSGPGLVNIYNFLKDTGYAQEPAELAEQFKHMDNAAVISQTGLQGTYKISEKALELFASILGAKAGNLVLTFLAAGGVYIAGGIAPKIAEKLTDGTVKQSYVNKGRLSYVVEKTPLYIIQDDKATLLGAASIAGEL